jgi:uncharacterized protein (DUF305 family)
MADVDLTTASTTTASTTTASTTAAGDDEPLDENSDEILLPWWYSWWRVAAVSAAVALLAVGAIAAAVREKQPDPDSVAVGFLQDMRHHHDQAVQTSLTFLELEDTDPLMRTIAREIVLGQQLENGMFVEILRGYSAAEENSTGEAMAWMGNAVPLDRMPGMASADDLDNLAASSGPAADKLFADLMIAHHEGGIVMGDYAAEHAETDRVVGVAAAIARNQTVEIVEIRDALGRAQARDQS